VKPSHAAAAVLRRLNWSGHQCSGDLTTAEPLLAAMHSGVRQSGAKVRGRAIEQFLPHGVTLVLVLSESHFVLSTWPEYRFASIDVAVCSEEVDLELLLAPLQALLKAGHVENSFDCTQMHPVQGSGLLP